MEENYFTKQGSLPPRTSLSQLPYGDSNLLDEITKDYNMEQKAEEAFRYPGITGASQKFAGGGLASLKKKYYD